MYQHLSSDFEASVQ